MGLRLQYDIAAYWKIGKVIYGHALLLNLFVAIAINSTKFF